MLNAEQQWDPSNWQGQFWENYTFCIWATSAHTVILPENTIYADSFMERTSTNYWKQNPYSHFLDNWHFVFLGLSKGPQILELECSDSVGTTNLGWINSLISSLNKICSIIQALVKRTFMCTERLHIKNHFFCVQLCWKHVNLSKSWHQYFSPWQHFVI